tara:strand:- start:371 stop:817 length:447 start_codon:yes stop_codon:yes gene_type:complete
MGRIVSFRGLMKTGTEEMIPLSTNNGLIGYKIRKFEIMGEKPGATNYETVMKIFKVSQPLASITAEVDFSDNRLLAAATYQGNSASFNYPTTQFTVFDNEVFNQDIYITHEDLQNESMNFYIELEQMKLDLSEQTVATLKDIRNVGAE